MFGRIQRQCVVLLNRLQLWFPPRPEDRQPKVPNVIAVCDLTIFKGYSRLQSWNHLRMIFGNFFPQIWGLRIPNFRTTRRRKIIRWETSEASLLVSQFFSADVLVLKCSKKRLPPTVSQGGFSAQHGQLFPWETAWSHRSRNRDKCAKLAKQDPGGCLAQMICFGGLGHLELTRIGQIHVEYVFFPNAEQRVPV